MNAILSFFAFLIIGATAASIKRQTNFIDQNVYNSNPEANAPILKQIDERSPDGSYNYEYETGNGIQAQETSFQNGAERVVRGHYSYIGPDGQTYRVDYIADRNGYRASGAHLPIQPHQFPEQTPSNNIIVTQLPSAFATDFIASTTAKPAVFRDISFDTTYTSSEPEPQFIQQQRPADSIISITPRPLAYNPTSTYSPSIAFSQPYYGGSPRFATDTTDYNVYTRNENNYSVDRNLLPPFSARING